MKLACLIANTSCSWYKQIICAKTSQNKNPFRICYSQPALEEEHVLDIEEFDDVKYTYIYQNILQIHILLYQ